MSPFLHQHTYKATLFYIYTLCFLSVTVNEMTMVPSIPNPMTCSADHFLSSLPRMMLQQCPFFLPHHNSLLYSGSSLIAQKHVIISPNFSSIFVLDLTSLSRYYSFYFLFFIQRFPKDIYILTISSSSLPFSLYYMPTGLFTRTSQKQLRTRSLVMVLKSTCTSQFSSYPSHQQHLTQSLPLLETLASFFLSLSPLA